MDKRLKKAQRAHEAGDLAGACLLYGKVARDAPHDVNAWYLLGTAEAERGRLRAAAEAFARAESLEPRSAMIQNNLGNVLQQGGDPAGALLRYRRAVELDPRLPQARFNLGRAFHAAGDLEQAEPHLRAALELDPGLFHARHLLGVTLANQGRHEEARPQLEASARSAHPGYAVEARHYLDLVEGRNPVAPAPDYVRNLFNAAAGTFDHHLMEDLGYSAPQQAAALLEQLRPAPLGCAVDLGCGTGLSGSALRPRVGRLEGVDLAPAMLELARAKGIYDGLTEGDAEGYLAAAPAASLDLILALDVLIYIGDPGPLLHQAARALASRGLVILSVEALPEAGPYRLLPSGRYAHDPATLSRLARGLGLREAAGRAFPLRRHGAGWIEGWIGAFEKPGTV